VLDPRCRLRTPVRETPQLLLTPFIDILLVVLCFVLAISFQIRAALDVKLPEAKTGQILTEGRLTVAIKRDSEIIFQGKPVTLEGLAAVIRQSLAKLSKAAPVSAVIQGDQQIPYAVLVKVMDILRAQGITDLSLLTDSPGGS